MVDQSNGIAAPIVIQPPQITMYYKMIEASIWMENEADRLEAALEEFDVLPAIISETIKRW